MREGEYTFAVGEAERVVGHTFTDRALLVRALTHRSFSNEHAGALHNERLEFLGDAVLQFVSTTELYTLYPDADEGTLSLYRSLIVKTDFLIQVAEVLSLQSFLRVSSGQRRELEKGGVSILADAVEAVIGAVYLDGGIDAARLFIRDKALIDIGSYLSNVPLRDPKTALQEFTQREQGITPEYVVLKEQGPDHDKVFEVGVKIGDKVVTTAVGKSKQEAAQEAAQEALTVYGVRETV